MEAKELMIGDWMYNCIADIRFKIYPQFFSQWYNRTEQFTATIQPIHLTPEILEKNGFVANKHVYPYPFYEYINEEDKLKVGFAFPQGDKTSYKEPWVYIDSERVFVEHLPCVFVHQLQHALRFCGIDKEIEL